MSIWVCPHCPNKKSENEIEKIEGLARLYAYPCEPRFKNGGLVILDSGAFGLHQAGQKINSAYMQRLSEHYKKYCNENVFCVAPDEFLNPEQSMLNFIKWKKAGLFEKIVPVLQSERKLYVNEKSLLQQATFYKKYSDVIFFSNPSLNAEQAKAYRIDKIFKKIKNIGFKWIHNLGAGWNLADIKLYSQMQYLDSFDSISYYSTKDVSEFGSLDAVKNVKEIIKCLKT